MSFLLDADIWPVYVKNIKFVRNPLCFYSNGY